MYKKEKIQNFPIANYLDQICDSLKKSSSHVMVLTAETAAGKSTVLPLALLENFEGKIIMTQPRRLAVLGVANRVSELLEEECGKGEVGYKIHLENRVSKNTRLEVVTEGILVRQLQKDPVLENYNLVIIDEFHERSINTDLLLAFLKEALELRDDLYVIIMSATIDTEKLQNYFLKDDRELPLFQIPGRQFPVEVVYKPEFSVENAVLQEINRSEKGNILVFLPGISDIRKVFSNLQDELREKDVELLILHSSISLEEQKKVLKDSKSRRVILSSSIAETSLTVPGVTIVIDSGLARVNRINISTGMENLSTEVESEFSAEQRKGRAGRLQAGRCIRLWSEFDPRIKDFPPEIMRADLTELVLECAERGIFYVDGIDWLDKPSKASWTEAGKLLQNLGMLKEDFRINDKGKAALELGLHPRLAAIAIDGGGQTSGGISSECKKLILKYSSYSKASPEIQEKFINDLNRRLKDCFGGSGSVPPVALGSVPSCKNPSLPLVLSGFPDRIARCVSECGVEPAEYQFPSGRKALLYQGRAPQWIVAPSVLAGKSEGSIFEFEELNQQEIDDFMEIHAQKRQNCRFSEGKILKTEDLCYGQIVLSSKKIQSDPGDLQAAWINEVQTKGFNQLPLDAKIENLLLRYEFYNQQKGDKGLADDKNLKLYLEEKIEEWLSPFISGISKLTSQIVYDALFWFLKGTDLEKNVPESLLLPNGRKCKVKYERQEKIKPVIEIIIQRIFGCFETPEICGQKVLLKLLSPASRPLQITEDLANFWTGAWPEICKEMKGRYPKHNWNYKLVDD